MSDLPTDVIHDILSRLPVKTLLQFRCVSKLWCALIDSPNFIKSHLKRSIENQNNVSLVLEGDGLYSVNFESLDKAVKLDDPLKSESYRTEVFGSCNGLLCLFNTEKGMVLWNPSTRKHRKLLVPLGEFCKHQFIVYGFGHDVVNDDYKVVRIVQFNGMMHSEVKIYSLKLNSWRRIPDLPYHLRYKRVNGMLVSGALHWIVTRKPFDTANLIAAFDIGNEKYTLVPQPEYSHKDFIMYLGVLGENLSIFCNYYLVRIDIWVMKEYGVKESWTKLFSFAQPSVIRSFQYMRPIAYSKSGEEILLEHDDEKFLHKKFIWYDLEKETLKNIRIRDMPNPLFSADICLGSLVPLGSDGGCDGKRLQAQ
ncbi:hypothetical protein F0562_017326 [Nyssa sinensis]|uniref:F-box domain-containing protein n=1 Tax=Nyssa sinensis TaxID=561372 RepID=A0A5J4ZGR3_9ASTE|nr:hypothetical protein F0562_017326 [Nyssa sinensis]